MPVVSTRDILYRYIPLAGGASSLAFSVNVMDPNMFSSLFGSYEGIVANALWFNAHFGVGLYVYKRPHLKPAPQYQRIIVSVYGAMLVNYGSMLFWATTRTLLPSNNALRICFGIASGAAILAIGTRYLKFVDEGTSSKED